MQAPANAGGRPIAFVLTPGNVADIGVAIPLLDKIATPQCLLADYDADRLRKPLEAANTKVVAPSNGSRQHAYPPDRTANSGATSSSAWSAG